MAEKRGNILPIEPPVKFCTDCQHFLFNKACAAPDNAAAPSPASIRRLAPRTLVDPSRPDLAGVEAIGFLLDPDGSFGRQRAWPQEHRAAGWFAARWKNLCGREGRWWRGKPGNPPSSGAGVKTGRAA